MKVIVVYFSRTGTTAAAAKAISDRLKCPMLEISCKGYNKGLIGYYFAGRDGMKEKTAPVFGDNESPAKYDVVIIGTPVWAWNLSVPIRSYLRKHKLEIKKAAFFCTRGGSDPQKIFSNMLQELEQAPLVTLALLQKDVKAGKFAKAVDEFIERLKKGYAKSARLHKRY